ncbi:nuclear transport factor 2 family protein [Streptomyces sp. NPDC048172]|uniref:nuclear transport factor 2 family protein n=1 Tax=Streptomyces sp. NPDC048172 TaxID=3365505 RepID=UPI0037245A77
MRDVRELVERYVATWNEHDPVARRRALGELWAGDALYVHPLSVAEGIDAIDAMIAVTQRQYPDFVLSLTGEVDAHHALARFTWGLGPKDGEAVLAGTDVAVLAEDGRITAIHGFLDKAPF